MKVVLRNVYYFWKPWLPVSGRMAVRRWLARRKRAACLDQWPIKPQAGQPPAGWTGWPEGKQFAFVLTHDVEGQTGLRRCRELASLEARFGFVSCFYLIPEGGYVASPELRESLVAAGAEVGVHDLKHDGKLFLSRKVFTARAQGINRYLEEWGAAGFRAGFMLHNLDWLKELNIQYDTSTFDTDPFEPQPDGVDTIFPFWVSRANGQGYVELPYTLPQDFTLFFLFEEGNIETWKRKLDWVAERGGMALLNTHPDYMAFRDSEPSRQQFPVALYEEFLQYARDKYAGRFWHALPRDVARFVAASAHHLPPKAPLLPRIELPPARRLAKIWVDLDNTPHVPFFEPIIEELARRGHEIMVTARDAFQVCDLADQKGMRYLKVGRHSGKNRIRKLTGLFYRALQLAPPVLREKPALGLSHGSRSQVILCNLLRIPTVLLADYEHAKLLPLMWPTWEMVPEVVPDSALYCPKNRIRKYPGIKEDVYVARLQPDSRLLAELGLNGGEIIVTVRPPATEAHYHNPESDRLFERFMDRACRTPGVRVVLLPRNKKQVEWLRRKWPYWFAESRTVVPAGAVDGLNLLWHSDLVVSGGGTMNREAAALGVPVYSIFRGKIGAVDQCLERQGRLILIESLEDVDSKIRLARRPRQSPSGAASVQALSKIVEHIEEILAFHYPPGDPADPPAHRRA